jgi:site-specific recombinase XerD
MDEKIQKRLNSRPCIHILEFMVFKEGQGDFMRTYINELQGIIPRYEDCPPTLKKFIVYMRTRKNLSEKTVNGYYIDLRMFIRFLMIENGLVDRLSGMKFSPHKFRHTAATLMYQSGTDLLELSQILGHESVSTTDKVQ